MRGCPNPPPAATASHLGTQRGSTTLPGFGQAALRHRQSRCPGRGRTGKQHPARLRIGRWARWEATLLASTCDQRPPTPVEAPIPAQSRTRLRVPPPPPQEARGGGNTEACATGAEPMCRHAASALLRAGL